MGIIPPLLLTIPNRYSVFITMHGAVWRDSYCPLLHRGSP